MVDNDGEFRSQASGSGYVQLHLPHGGHVRLHLLHSSVHAWQRGGDTMTDGDPHGMSRRQLIRHSAWFGAAVGLAVVGGEVISHVAPAQPPPHATHVALRSSQ